MIKNLKKYNIIILVSVLLGGILYPCLFHAQAALQIEDYPSFLNIRANMNFVELASAIFNFILLISGLAAFVMIVLGGSRYLTSAGDPSKMDDAKSQIFSAILGLVVIFASWMILNTINPELVSLRNPDFTASPSAPGFGEIRVPGTCSTGKSYPVEMYSSTNFTGERECYEVGEEEKSYDKSVLSIKISGTNIKLFSEANFGGKNICFSGSVPNTDECILAGANDCVPNDDAGWNKPKSFKISASCLNPGTTLTESGGQVWESCGFWAKGYIPTCIYQ